jgi:hypothetical protein
VVTFSFFRSVVDGRELIHFLGEQETALIEERKVSSQSHPEGGRNPCVCLPEEVNIIV